LKKHKKTGKKIKNQRKQKEKHMQRTEKKNIKKITIISPHVLKY
jgi:hypothetical protein